MSSVNVNVGTYCEVKADYDGITLAVTASVCPAGSVQLQADWEQTDSTAVDFIKNKPTLEDSVIEASQNAVKSSGIWTFVTGLVSAVWSYLTNIANITYEPTGIDTDDKWNQTLAIRFNSTTMKAEVDGYWSAYLKGQKILEVASGETWESPSISLIAGVKGYFLTYCESSGQFNWVQTNGFDFRCVMLAFVYFRADGTFLFAIREAHGFMQWQSHAAEHSTVGTIRHSGGDITDYILNSTTATNRRPLISSTVVRDEDIKTTITALVTESYTVAWLSGDAATSLPAQGDIVQLSTNSLPQLNVFDGASWGLQELGNNQFMSVWVIAMPVANDSESQRYRYIFWTGQSQTSSIEGQLGRSFRDLNLLDFTNISPEFVPIAQIVVRRLGGNWQLASVVSLTGSRAQQLATPAGQYLSAVTSDTTLTGVGTPSDPLSVTPIQAPITPSYLPVAVGDALQEIGQKVAGLQESKKLIYSLTTTEDITNLEILLDNEQRIIIEYASNTGMQDYSGVTSAFRINNISSLNYISFTNRYPTFLFYTGRHKFAGTMELRNIGGLIFANCMAEQEWGSTSSTFTLADRDMQGFLELPQSGINQISIFGIFNAGLTINIYRI